MMAYKRFLKSSVLLLASIPLVAQADWPVANSDSAEATTAQSISIPVLQNDTGDGLVLTMVDTTSKKGGEVSINADKQTVTYQSADGFEGTDSFWYDFKDDEGRTNAAKVTVVVTADDDDIVKPDEWPTASNDSAETSIDTPVEIKVLDNDNGVGLKLTEIDTTTVKWGKAAISDNGQTITYTPPSGYTGEDSFWYVFSDNWGRTNAGKVTLNITDEPVHSGWPVAVTDSAEVINTLSVVIPVLDNDLGQNLSLIEVNTTTKRGGHARIEGSRVRYLPPVGFSGEDSFWYAFSDDQGRTNSAKVTVTVEANTENSVVKFCGANYSTDGTPEGTFVTQDEVEDNIRVGGLGTHGNYQPDRYTGTLEVIDNRRYYVEKTDTTTTFWLDDGETKTMLETGDDNLNITGIGVFGDTLLYRVIEDSETYLSLNHANEPIDPELVGLTYHSHDGTTRRVLTNPSEDYISSLYLMRNNLTPYFLSGVVDSEEGGRGKAYYYRLDEETGKFINVTPPAIPPLNRIVNGFFYHNGIDYSDAEYRINSSDGYKIAKSLLTQTDYHTTPATPLNQIHARALEYAFPVYSKNRLLFVTGSHTEYAKQEGSDTYTVVAQYPPKLFTINTNNDFVELATCSQ